MAAKVRVGVVGTSWWADLAHLPALQSHPGAEVVAICGRNRENAEAMAQKYAVPQVFTDYREMIAKGGLDAITVSTPDDTHCAITLAALDAGLHVLCEKPLAMNAADAWTMYERAEAAGVKHMVYFTWHWLSVWQYVHQLVAEGAIGRCFAVNLHFQGSYGLDGKYAWRFDANRANGIVGDLGSHMIELARWFAGDITRVSAHLATFVDRPGADGQKINPANDDGIVLVEFASGAHGVIRASAVARRGDRATDQGAILHGEKGMLDASATFYGSESGAVVLSAGVDDQPLQRFAIPDLLSSAVDHSAPFITQLEQQWMREAVGPRLFIDSIIEDRVAGPTFYDGFRVQQVVDAALKSHQTGQWVSIPDSAPLR